MPTRWSCPTTKVAQVAVAGIAATNFAVRYPMRFVPGLDRVYEAVGPTPSNGSPGDNEDPPR